MRISGGFIDQSAASIDAAAFRARWPNFAPSELACRCCGHLKMSVDFLDKVQRIRTHCEFPMKVTSGYRCPSHNNRVSKTGLSGPHTTGRAVDISCSLEAAYDIAAAAFKHGITGLGVRQAGPHVSRFLHLDDLPATPRGPRPTIWNY